MSINVKLSDQDAELVGNILTDVVKLQLAVLENKETVVQLRNLDRSISSTRMANHVMEIVGLFRTTVRANSK